MTKITLPDDDDSRGQVQGWLQVDKRVHEKMWRFGLKNPSALSVLHFLTSRMKRGTNGVMLSYTAMAHAMNIGERTAKTAIAALSEARFIQIVKSGKSNVYLINSQVAWQGKRGARLAAFNAGIVVSEKEQIKPVDEIIEEGKHMDTVPVFDDEGNGELFPNED